MNERVALELDIGGPPWVIFVSEVHAAHIRLAETFRGMLRNIDGRMMLGPTSAFRELAKALEFPSYFGYNWDALDECLGDVRSWLSQDAILVLVDQADSLIAIEHLPMLVKVLCSGSERAAALQDEDGVARVRQRAILRVVFLLNSSSLKEVSVRLRKSGRSLTCTDTHIAVS
jgi:hypothetical protein